MLAAHNFDTGAFRGLEKPHVRRILLASLLSIGVHTIVVWQWFANHHITPPIHFDFPQTLEITLLTPPKIQPSVVHPAPLKPRQAENTRAPATTNTIPSRPAMPAFAPQVPAASEVVTAPSPPPQEDTAPVKEVASTPPLYQAAYLHNPPPVYPLSAKRRGMEGKVLLRAEIQPDGMCSRVELKKSSGWELLDQAALEAVKHWRFEPARRGAQAVVEWAEIPINFSLQG